VKPQRWTRDRLGAVIDVRGVLDEKVHAMEAHQTQKPDLVMWAKARAELPEIFTEETFIREFPEPGGPPLETDLFAGIRSSQGENPLQPSSSGYLSDGSEADRS